MGLIVKIVGPLTKLLAYVVADGDAEQFAAPISPSAQRLGIHPPHPCLWFLSREHPLGGDVLKRYSRLMGSPDDLFKTAR
jgi:hypothetical protein